MSDSKTVCNCDACEYRLLVFDSLDSNEVNSLCDYKHERIYKKGEIIVKEGEPITEFFYLKTGLVKSFHTIPDGREKIVHIATPMDFVSLLSVFSETKHRFSLAALDETTVCCINLPKIKQLIEQNGKFAFALMEKMSKNADKIIMQNLCLNMKNLRGRIAFILLLFADNIFKNDKFELPVSRKEIAQLIDMTTENVIRILSEFRKDGIIAAEGKDITILKKSTLIQIARHG
jgi:CRP/FNR family transcriptional regulator